MSRSLEKMFVKKKKVIKGNVESQVRAFFKQQDPAMLVIPKWLCVSGQHIHSTKIADKSNDDKNDEQHTTSCT